MNVTECRGKQLKLKPTAKGAIDVPVQYVGGGDVLARLPDLPGNMLAGAGLREEGIEAVVSDSDRLVARHLPIRLDTWTQIQNIKEVEKI